MSRSSDNHSVSDDVISSVCSSEMNNNDIFSESNSYSAEHQKKKAYNLNPNIYVLNWKRRDGRRVVNYKITIYGTPNTPNTYIVNAETGSKYQYRVGTSDEDMFFSTLLATGDSGTKTAPLLFYDNPEQYEAHLMCEVPMDIKRAWYVKYYELLAKKERKEKTMLMLGGRKMQQEPSSVAHIPSHQFTNLSDALRSNLATNPAKSELISGFPVDVPRQTNNSLSGNGYSSRKYVPRQNAKQ